jgi:hypothetical protein
MLAWAGDLPGRARAGGLDRLGHLALDGAAPQRDCHAAHRRCGPRWPALSLVGEGRKARIVPIAPPRVPILDDYVSSLRPALTTSAHFFVNPSAHQGERYEGHWGPETVAKLVQRAGTGGWGLGAPLSPSVAALLCHLPAAPRC